MSIKTQLRRRETANDSHLPVNLHPLLRRLYAQRGVQGEQELERSVKGMLPWQLLDGIDAAVDILQQALADGRRIMIVGDFDADGATSTALTVLALRSMGGNNVQYLVPNRF
ncbi:Single-stranded-DNA-specific exonuclease recJ [Serratia odorifera]|nr:Single-stranded-DNA-specific exonuclease recJ [Serratia odorifera]